MALRGCGPDENLRFPNGLDESAWGVCYRANQRALFGVITACADAQILIEMTYVIVYTLMGNGCVMY